jgi:hypothetical protein
VISKMELLASKAYRKYLNGQCPIEFYEEWIWDWFFHCHILYHMMGGMARVFSYDTPRMRMKGFPCFWVSSWNKQILFLGNGGCSISFYGTQLAASNLEINLTCP